MPIPCRAKAWPSTSIINWQRDRLAAAGQDIHLVPDEPFRFLRMKEVRAKVGLGTSTIFRLMAEGKFPKSIAIDRAHSAQAA
jgi:prophage regulatory protein